MKNANQSNKPGHVTKGDLFDDLGFLSCGDAGDEDQGGDLASVAAAHRRDKGFKQSVFGDDAQGAPAGREQFCCRGKQPSISITKLIQFAGRLNLEARVKLIPTQAGEACLLDQGVHGESGEEPARVVSA